MKKSELIFRTAKKFGNFEGERLRGYIAHLFSSDVILHNHLNEYEFLYESSKIQYKTIDGYLSIVGLGSEAYSIFKDKLMSLTELHIGDETFEILDKKLNVENFILEVEEDAQYEYTFTHHWLGLNQDNYKLYKSGELSLDRALTNNLIELFKMCEYRAENKIVATVNLREESIKRKDIFLKGFLGTFKCNVLIPDNLGLGKRKSTGFGTIKRIK